MDSVAVLHACLRGRLSTGSAPLFVGIDGCSGAGKSTLAEAVSKDLAEQVTVIEGDDFYAGGSAETWDNRTTAEQVDRVINWSRQRDVLAQLRRDCLAQWDPFDWDGEGWDSDHSPLAPTRGVFRAAPVIVLEGAYSCRPELHDLLDLLVLVDAPRAVRRGRLLERDGAAYRADWASRWARAEEHYFSTIMPPERFDLVLDTA